MHPTIEWQFKTMSYSWLGLIFYGLASLGMGAIIIQLFQTVTPIIELWFVKLASIFLLMWLIEQTWQEWLIFVYWNHHVEYLRLDKYGVDFCIFPYVHNINMMYTEKPKFALRKSVELYSDSVFYSEIKQVIHWYEQRTEPSSRRPPWDEDIGIIIITPAQEIKLNLERMIQSDDGVSFGLNSSVVIAELNKRMKAFRAA